MKRINRILVIALFVTIASFFGKTNVKAADEYTTIMTYDGTSTVKYKNTNIEVQIPTTYKGKDSEFRGVWVSAYAGDIGGWKSTAADFKEELTTVLDNMEASHLNTIIFHLRTHNDAFYQTSLAPQSPYVSGANYREWNYLEWFIEECHSRGIEFHAWLNPYRISSTSTTKSAVLSKYQNYYQNPAHFSENVLVGAGGAILDPGRPAVRKYLVDVCMELVENYDIDAIHFDDYFYISNVDDSETYNMYKADYGNVGIETFRRLQVDQFIEDLSEEMYQYNIENDRCVQLGISPSGVYRNGSYNTNYVYDSDGTLISPLASNTTGYSHYDAPLYSDTKKWIDNEWIDYILPQLYGSFENGGMPYADTIDWWSNVVTYKKVNLYIGIGLYQYKTSTSDMGWKNGTNVFSNEVLYATKFDTVSGIAIYQYRSLVQQMYDKDVKKVIDEFWKDPVMNPEIKRYNTATDDVNLTKIIKGSDVYTLVFSSSNNKNYSIYRINQDNSKKFLGVVNAQADMATFIDRDSDVTEKYTYSILPVSFSNKLGNPVEYSTDMAVSSVDFELAEFTKLKVTGRIKMGSRLTLSFNEVNFLAGNMAEYEIYTSLDNKTWTLANTLKTNSIGSYTHVFRFTDDGRQMYIKVIAKNDLGSVESQVYNVKIGTVDADEFMEEMYTNYINSYNDFFGVEE